MKYAPIVMMAMLMLAFAPNVFALTNITDCVQITSSDTYQLVSDINVNASNNSIVQTYGACIYSNSAIDITIEGNGYAITGFNVGSTEVAMSFPANVGNLVINDVNITDVWDYAINAVNIDNINVTNSVFRDGLILQPTSSMYVLNNDIRTTSNLGVLNENLGSETYFENNNISCTTIDTGNGGCVDAIFYTPTKLSFINNNITNYAVPFGYSTYYDFVGGSIHDYTFVNNYLYERLHLSSITLNTTHTLNVTGNTWTDEGADGHSETCTNDGFDVCVEQFTVFSSNFEVNDTAPVALTAYVCDPDTTNTPCNGTGTVGDPYIITTPNEFDSMRNNLTAYYELGNNLDMAGFNFSAPIGDWNTAFSGAFDGKGYSVDNFHWTYTDPDYSHPGGIFGALDAGGKWFRNVHFDNYSFIMGNVGDTTCCSGAFIGADDSSSGVDISNVHFTNSYVFFESQRDGGGIIGYNNHKDTDLYNLSFEGTMYGHEAGGGIVGYLVNGQSAEYLSFTGDLYFNASVTSPGWAHVGGLIGEIQGNSLQNETFLKNSYFNGNIILEDDHLCASHTYGCFVGGMIGISPGFPTKGTIYGGYIEDSYFNGTLPTATGDVTVYFDYGSVYSAGHNCTDFYYNNDETGTNGTTCSSGITAVAPDDFDDETALSGLDFVTVWNVDYLSTPKFLWQPVTPVPQTAVVNFEAKDSNGDAVNTFCAYETSVPGTQWCTTNGSVTSDALSVGRYNFTIEAGINSVEYTNVPVGENEFTVGDEAYFGEVIEHVGPFNGTYSSGNAIRLGSYHALTFPYQFKVENFFLDASSTPRYGMNNGSGTFNGRGTGYINGNSPPNAMDYIVETGLASAHWDAAPTTLREYFTATYWNDTHVEARLDGEADRTVTGADLSQEGTKGLFYTGDPFPPAPTNVEMSILGAGESFVEATIDPYAITECQTLTQPGVYTLTQNITGLSANSACLDIQATGVTINGGVYSVTASGGATAAVYLAGFSANAFVMNGGTLIGQDGIKIPSSYTGLTVNGTTILATQDGIDHRGSHSMNTMKLNNSHIEAPTALAMGRGFSFTVENNDIIGDVISTSAFAGANNYLNGLWYDNYFEGTVSLRDTSGGPFYNNVVNGSFFVNGVLFLNQSTVGNTWTNPSQTGFSDSCLTTDSVSCINAYTVGVSTDYHPVALGPAYEISSCADISVGGVWTVAADLTGNSSTGQSCLYVSADDVVLEAGSFEIDCNSGLASDTSSLFIEGANNVTINNGTFTCNGTGIALEAATNFELNDNYIDTEFYGLELDYSTLGYSENGVINNIQVDVPDYFIGNGGTGAIRMISAKNVEVNGGWLNYGVDTGASGVILYNFGNPIDQPNNITVHGVVFNASPLVAISMQGIFSAGDNVEFYNNTFTDANTDRSIRIFTGSNISIHDNYLGGDRGLYVNAVSGTNEVYNNEITANTVLNTPSANVVLYNNLINSSGVVTTGATIHLNKTTTGNTWTTPAGDGYSDTCTTLDGVTCLEEYVVGSSTDYHPFSLNDIISAIVTFNAYDEYLAAGVNTFCAYDVTNASEQWCTSNGTASTILEQSTYTFKLNASGMYEVEETNDISVDPTVNFTTKEYVVVSNVLVDGSATPSAVWNETTSQVNVSWTHNGVDTATEVDYGTGSAVVYNTSYVLINTNNLAVGENTFTVTTNESYATLQSQDADASNQMNVSKLGKPRDLAPNSGQVTQTLFNATWNPALNGVGSVTYDSIIEINGMNYSIDTATPNLYSTVNTTLEGISKVYVRASDDYFTTAYAVGGDFEIIFEIGISSFACPSVLPNEENLPTAAQFQVEFDADLAVGFTTTTLDMTVEQGAESVVLDETDCSYVQNSPTSRTYTCNASMNYWFAPGAYDVNVTVYDAADETNQVESSLCTYGTLIASKRTVDTITFPGAAPGTIDIAGTPAMNMQNTGNVDLDLYMTAQDLTGRTNPAATLLASNFKAGATLGTSVAMTDNVQADLNMQLLRGDGSDEDVWLWLSMPSNQDPQEYFTPDAWEIQATG